MIRLLNLVVFLFLSLQSIAQCGLNQSFPIADLNNDLPDTTNISLLVSGAVNNNLASVEQGVCGVGLKFRHPFMKELFIELISPSGQMVRLVGGDIVATNTPFITWDVTFVPCGSTASPDPGFFPVWENNQLWVSFNTYTGSYHPNTGCLENFNAGPVNGTWTIRCIDFLDESKGTLLDASLFFCDDTGVSCGVCRIDPGAIQNPPLTACENDASLDIVLDKTFTIVPDPLIYNYTNIILKDTVVSAYQADPDLRSFAPGTYKICPVQVTRATPGILPAVGSSTTVEAMAEFFFQSGACAGVSDSCMTVTIFPQKVPSSVTKYICNGSGFTINDTTYYTEGLHTVVFETGVCDSVVNLDLRVYDFAASVVSDKDSISCSNNTIAIQALTSGDFPLATTYQWTTADGLIDGDPSEFIIDARKAGTYQVVVASTFANATCRDTVSKTIFLDETFPKITLTADTLTCRNDTVTIALDVSIPFSTATWVSNSSQPFIQLPSGDIRIWEPGKYLVSLLADNGCSGSDSITITENVFLPTVQFSSEVLTCERDSVSITTTLSAPGNYTYSWTGTDMQNANLSNPVVFSAGTYDLLLTNVTNGCTGVYSHTVQENKILPLILTLQTDTINCFKTSSSPVVTVDHPVSKYLWQGPGVSTSSSSPSFTREGNYSVTVTSATNGCEASASFEIIKDTLVPEVILFTDSITCQRDTAVIWYSSPIGLISTNWSGPGYSAAGPVAQVSMIGTYRLVFTAKNGCMGNSEILVANSMEIPDVEFSVDSFNCSRDTLLIRLDFARDMYDYRWDGPALLQTTGPEPQITAPGTYTVTVTDPVTGCDDDVIIEVPDFRIYPDPKFVFDTLDCSKDSVQVLLTNEAYTNILYTGDGFLSSDLSPFIKQTGTYSYTIVNVHHCVSTGNFDIVRNDTLPIISALFEDFRCFQDSVVMNGASSMTSTTFVWAGPEGYSRTGTDVKTHLPGLYTVTGTAPNGCKSEYNFTIGYDTIRPMLNLEPADTLTCIKTTVVLSAIATPVGTTIRWLPVDKTGNTIMADLPGLYIAEATGPNNCITLDSVRVVEDRKLPQFAASASVITCKDQLSTIRVEPQGTASISWANGSNPVNLIQGQLNQVTSFGGNYEFTLTNSEGCSVMGVVTVVKDTVPPLLLGIITDTIDCLDPVGRIGVVLDKNSIEFLWNGPMVADVLTDSLLSVTKGGVYYVMFKGDNFCSNIATIKVEEDINLPQVEVFTDTLTCNKGKVTIGVVTPEPDHSYHWAGPDNFESTAHNPKVFLAGTYTVTVTGPNGCKSVREVKVADSFDKPIITIADTLYLPCDTSAIILSADADRPLATYRWLYPDGTISNLKNPVISNSGTYKLKVTGENGCPSDELVFRVLVDNQPPGFEFVTDTITCDRPQATIRAFSSEANVFYEWKSPTGLIYTTQSVTTAEDGTFRLIVFDVNKCRDSIDVVVAIDTLSPGFNVNQTGFIQCESRNVRLTALPKDPAIDNVAAWTTSDGNITTMPTFYEITLDEPGTYKFEIRNVFSGCKSDTSVRIEVTPQGFTIADADVESPICVEVDNGSILFDSLNGLPPYQVELNGVDQKGKLKYEGLAPGTYNFAFKDSLGCELERSITIEEGADPVVSLDKEKLILFGDSILLNPVITPAPVDVSTFMWTKLRDSVLCEECPNVWVRPFVNSIYRFDYSLDGLCKRTAEILIRVKNDIDQSIPNIFNPSGSGNSRFFVPQTRGIDRINYIYVFDKWAENVYRAENLASGDPAGGWDGTFDGKDCQPGVYIVIAEFVLSDGTVWKYKGDITLIR